MYFNPVKILMISKCRKYATLQKRPQCNDESSNITKHPDALDENKNSVEVDGEIVYYQTEDVEENGKLRDKHNISHKNWVRGTRSNTV